MADHECSPLWEPGTASYSVAPETLPISADLRKKLWAWAAMYDATLNRADPATSSFANEAERHYFIRQGLILQDYLQQELGEGFVVEYFDRY